MSILVTGGSGFVGLAIAEALLARGEAVTLLDRAPPPPAALRALNPKAGHLRWAVADVRDQAAITAAFAEFRPRRLVHAAALTIGGAREEDDAGEAIAVNVLGTLNALRAGAAAGIERAVFLSSASVYGESALGIAPLDEAATLPMPRTVYAISKYSAERLALRWGELSDLSVTAARLSSVFGPWERHTGVRQTMSPIFQVMHRAAAGEPVILPRPGRRDWVYSRDAAGAVLALLDRREDEPGVVNVGLGDEWTVQAWCERLSTVRPGFAYRMAASDDTAVPTIDYHGPNDRAPLSIARLAETVGFRPAYGLEAAQADYLAWIDAMPDYGV